MNNLIGDKLKLLREEYKLTQLELADKLGFNSKATIAQWESGKREPSLETLVQLAEIFNVKVGYFFDDKNENEILSEETKSKLYQKILEDLIYEGVITSHEAYVEIDEDKQKRLNAAFDRHIKQLKLK